MGRELTGAPSGPPTPIARVPLFVPTANAAAGVGEGRDLWTLAPGAAGPDALRMLRVLGRLIGAALRTGVRLSIAAAPALWKVRGVGVGAGAGMLK